MRQVFTALGLLGRNLEAMPRHLSIVAHTHWDREWYLPFEGFRMRLVPTIQGILDTLEADPDFPHFMLDGQVAAVDDYLGVLPQDEERIRSLVSQGRLSLGPWYVLMDEFLISGETIIRNLERGLARAQELGGAMAVGYLPDMFGHIAQMPQILRQFEVDRAVVWRGVPSTISTSNFTWKSPDGSQVCTEYLPIGYSNASQLPLENPEFINRFRDYLVESAHLLGDHVLMMNGGDHLPITPELPRLVRESNALQDDLHFEITSLEAYLATTACSPEMTWTGELRSGFRANLLMGVTSNHVGVKRQTARAEIALERLAEPLSALLLAPRDATKHFLDEAWLHLIHNAAHDSICACSVDEVVDNVLTRARSSETIARSITDEALKVMSARLSYEGVSVVNMSSFAQEQVIEFVSSGEEPPAFAQVLSQTAGTPGVVTIDAGMMKALLGMLQGPRFGDDAWIQSIEVREEDDGLHVTAQIGPEEWLNVPIAAAKQDIYARLGARPDSAVHLTLEQPTIYRVLALVGPVPSLGWTAAIPREPRHRVTLSSDGRVLSNGLLTVEINDDGTFSLNGTCGYGRLVDGGDLGDSYNYSPPADDRFIDQALTTTISTEIAGPLRTSIRVVREYELPEYCDEDTQSRIGSVVTAVAMLLTLDADTDSLELTLSWRNLSRDHRLRLHLPTAVPAAVSTAGSAFTTIRRGLEAEGRLDEYGLPTYPASRYLSAGNLSIAHHGVVEYELVDIVNGEAREVAITLIRATGMLSRLGMTYRPFPAGPLTPTPGLQMLGHEIEISFRLGLGCDPLALAERHDVPLQTISSFGGGDWEQEGQLLTHSGSVLISSLRRRASALELRIYNPSDEERTFVLPQSGATRTTMKGTPIAAIRGSLVVKAHEIVTLLLDEI